MTVDFTKVNNFKSYRLYVRDEEDGPPQTLEEVTVEAQRDTDKSGQASGIYKLIKYTEAAAPRATVLDVPA
jgi:hypothetical protein